MVDIRESSKDRNLALLVDVSTAGTSARACQIVDEFTARLGEQPAGLLVDLNAGDLLLTKGVLTKIKQQIQKAGAVMGTVYATVPQTQQAALDEGLYVKGTLITEWGPIRQPLPIQPTGKTAYATPPSTTVLETSKSPVTEISLPEFPQAKTPLPQPTELPTSAESASSLSLETVLEALSDEPLLTTRIETEVGVEFDTELPATEFETLYLRQTLRSGQTVRFDGNIVIVGDVHTGSEITAAGDIVVWGELRGIAHAGAKGDYRTEIRAMKIEALQLRIADYIARRPDRIYYHKDGAENIISPEVARVADGEIKIFKTTLPKG